MTDLNSLVEQLGFRFGDESLLRLALTHPSIIREESAAQPSNQRLEFLGDSVLQLALTLELYTKFPALGEGPLTKARAQLVNRHALAAQARRLRLGDYLRLSRGEELSGGRQRASTLADTFEALIGALFMDGGFEAARQFILRQYQEGLDALQAKPKQDNPKGELQEILQATSPLAPTYEVAAVTGPDHDRIFECTVHHQGVELGRGVGKSKKEAESLAALAALAPFQKPGEVPPKAAADDGEKTDNPAL